MNGREIFEAAMHMMDSGENSSMVSDFLLSLADVNFKPTDGVDDEFLDSLERVDPKTLSDLADCPICTNKFCDNEFPLLVKLPCRVQNGSKKEHIFDMDCIAPWLKMHSTCPLCRFDVKNVAQTRKDRLEEETRLTNQELGEDEDEEDNWELYG